jgi:putative phosphonate transport system ATP-binding protein
VCVAEIEIEPLLRVLRVSHYYGVRVGCKDISFELHPGEVIGIVGESGSGKTTLLNCISGRLQPSEGDVWYNSRNGSVEMYRAPEAVRRLIMRTEMGIVYQNARDGLRMQISAGGNIGERQMANGARHYGKIRAASLHWLEKVEIDTKRIDDPPVTFSGGMQQRLQIACNLVSQPRLVFMDEPTSGLDVSVQARLLDILRSLVTELALSMIVVTHDLAVARLLAHRLLVMRWGKVVEAGLTDQILDDPQHAYTQLLVSSILQP